MKKNRYSKSIIESLNIVVTLLSKYNIYFIFSPQLSDHWSWGGKKGEESRAVDEYKEGAYFGRNISVEHPEGG